MSNTDIKELVNLHGKEKIRALIKLRPLNVYMGIIALNSSSDPEFPILCEIDETSYKVEKGYKIKWTPIDEFSPKLNNIRDRIYSCETFYQSDFNSLVNRGDIKLYIEC
jgi:hypothetical protein